MKKETNCPAPCWAITERERKMFVSSQPGCSVLILWQGQIQRTESPFVYFDVPSQSKIMMLHWPPEKRALFHTVLISCFLKKHFLAVLLTKRTRWWSCHLIVALGKRDRWQRLFPKVTGNWSLRVSPSPMWTVCLYECLRASVICTCVLHTIFLSLIEIYKILHSSSCNTFTV